MKIALQTITVDDFQDSGTVRLEDCEIESGVITTGSCEFTGLD